jgi:hypothetical protein
MNKLQLATTLIVIVVMSVITTWRSMYVCSTATLRLCSANIFVGMLLVGLISMSITCLIVEKNSGVVNDHE